MLALSAELTALVESGVSMLVGTRDARLVPECVRAYGARVEPGGEEVTVFVPVATAATTVANLRDNGRVAVCFARICDHRSLQLKGGLVALEAAAGADRALVERYLRGFAGALGEVGLPTRLGLRLAHWPCHALRVRVEAVFDQTPGPGAGEPVAASAPEAPGP